MKRLRVEVDRTRSGATARITTAKGRVVKELDGQKSVRGAVAAAEKYLHRHGDPPHGIIVDSRRRRC